MRIRATQVTYISRLPEEDGGDVRPSELSAPKTKIPEKVLILATLQWLSPPLDQCPSSESQSASRSFIIGFELSHVCPFTSVMIYSCCVGMLRGVGWQADITSFIEDLAGKPGWAVVFASELLYLSWMSVFMWIGAWAVGIVLSVCRHFDCLEQFFQIDELQCCLSLNWEEPDSRWGGCCRCFYRAHWDGHSFVNRWRHAGHAMFCSTVSSFFHVLEWPYHRDEQVTDGALIKAGVQEDWRLLLIVLHRWAYVTDFAVERHARRINDCRDVWGKIWIGEQSGYERESLSHNCVYIFIFLLLYSVFLRVLKYTIFWNRNRQTNNI